MKINNDEIKIIEENNEIIIIIMKWKWIMSIISSIIRRINENNKHQMISKACNENNNEINKYQWKMKNNKWKMA